MIDVEDDDISHSKDKYLMSIDLEEDCGDMVNTRLILIKQNFLVC